MPRPSSVVATVGTIQRDGRQLVVELCRSDGREFIRLRSRSWDGGRWTTHQKLSIRSDEARGVIEALQRALESIPDTPASARRRRLDRVRDELRRHERARGRRWPSNT